MKVHFLLLALAAIVGNPAAPAPERLLNPRPGEVLLGPSTFNQTVAGVRLATRISVFLAVKVKPDSLRADARVIADLSDLQQKIGALVDTLPLPVDNRNHFGPDNLVARIWGKKLTLGSSGPSIDLKGDVDLWACGKNPLPCTRIEWDEKDVGLGKIKVPRLVAYDCNPPLKTQGLNQPVEASLPFHLTVVDPQTLAVELGTPSVKLGGTAGDLTAGILRIAGVEINSRLKEILNSAIRPELLKSSLPEELLRLNPTITKAELVDNAGALAASIELGADLDGKTLGELIRLLLAKR